MWDDLYRQMIVERQKHPLFRGHLEPHDIFYEDDNPTCGDHIEVTVQLDETGRVKAAAFDGSGCSISQVSADLLMESIQGKTLDEVKALTKDDVLEMLGGIELGPSRLKCALLSLKVLKAGAYGLDKKTEDEA